MKNIQSAPAGAAGHPRDALARKAAMSVRTTFVAHFLCIGGKRGNEAKIGADWAGFIGDFEGFGVGNERLQFGGNVYTNGM
jgi:hypothetical protein